MHRLPAIVALAFAAMAWSPRATAEIHRCNLPDGRAVFTDRACVDVGGIESLSAPGPGVGNLGRPQGCARTLRDLVFEVTNAIDTRDTNRLAGVYHWTGQSSSAGYGIIGRLDAIAHRPLLDVSVVLSDPPTDGDASLPAPAWQVLAANAGDADAADSTSGGDTGNAPAPVPPARRPVALRVEQTLANTATPASTVFGLRRNMGCWWISL